MWDLQLSTLKDKYRIIAYDVRGHGDSDAGDKQFSIDLLQMILIFIMDGTEIAKATVCGLSMARYIAINAAISHPVRFDSLILCDTNLHCRFTKIFRQTNEVIESIKNTV